MDTLPAHRALKTDLHLACVRGPDLGCVVPVEDNVVVGRGRFGICDPYCSREAGVLETNGRRAGMAYFRPRSGRPRRLTRHARLRIGTNTWEVRGRPQRLAWPGERQKAPSSNRFAALRWLMPLFMVLFVLRLAPRPAIPWIGAVLLVTVGLGAYVWRRMGKKWDEARLLLTVANRGAPVPSAANQSGTGESTDQLLVLERPGSSRKQKIQDIGSSAVAVVGRGEGHQQWIRAQAWVLGVDLDVGLFSDLSEVPTATSLVVGAREVGSKSWSQQMRGVLAADSGLPTLVRLTDLLGAPDAELLAKSWRSGGAGAARAPGHPNLAAHRAEKVVPVSGPMTSAGDLIAPVGITEEGLMEVNLTADGPHALIVGGTGSGKSEFLSTLILSLAHSNTPDDLRFALIDFKGGAGLSHLSGLPHVEHCISDLDGPRVAWLLRALDGALQRRKRAMAEIGARSWDEGRDLHQTASHLVGPRLVVVVDEFQVLSEAHPDLMDRLTKLAAQGRSLGFHLVLASQRPSGAVTPTLRSTLDLRVALRCTEDRDSIEVLGDSAAAELPRIPGRAIVGTTVAQCALADQAEEWVEAITLAWQSLVAQAVGDPEAQGGWVIPAALPERLQNQPGVLGLFEPTGGGDAQELRDGQQSVGIYGPVSHEQELAQMALHWVQPASTVWIGDEPLGFVADQQIGTLEDWEITVIPSADLGGAARALARIAANQLDAQVVVIRGLSKLLARLESAGGVEQVSELWRRLTRPDGSVRVVVTDVKPRPDLNGPQVTILRLPARQSLLGAALSPVLPTLVPGSSGTPVTRPMDLEQFVSPVWGRVLVTGMLPEATVWAQITLPAPPPPPPPPGSAPVSTPARRRARVKPAPVLEPGTVVLEPPICNAPLADALHALRATGRYTLMGADSWPHLTTETKPILALEAPREVLRLLAAKFPADGVWLQASFPLPTGSAVLTGRREVQFLNKDEVMAAVRNAGSVALEQAA